MKETIIEVKNLKKIYNGEVEAVKDISFEIFREELVAFIGPNGAGKTTTLKCLSGLLTPDKGKVSVLGFNPAKRKREFLSQISLVMGQKSQLWWELPPIETFKLNKEIYQIEDKKYNEVVNEMVKVLDIEDVIQKPTRNLSLGERMRSEIVSSLLHTPQVVFLDEPTIGLDVVSQYNLREFIKEYNHRYNASILLTSHNMEDVADLCKRIIIIDHGLILYDGKVADLVKEYAKSKYIHIILRQNVETDILNSFGKTEKINENEYLISVPREVVSETAKELLNKFEVLDLDINDLQLEDVIKGIFEGGYKI
jgi:ABC-2 type transport system ATP-binding protein